MTLDDAVELISENHPTVLMNRLHEAELADGFRAARDSIDVNAFLYQLILRATGNKVDNEVLLAKQETFMNFYVFTNPVDTDGMPTVYDLSQEAELVEGEKYNFLWPQSVKLMLALSTLTKLESVAEHLLAWSVEVGASFSQMVTILTDENVREVVAKVLPEDKHDWILKAVVEETAGSKKKITAAKKAIGVA